MEATVFVLTNFTVDIHNFCHILFIRSKSVSLAHIQGGGITQEYEYQEDRDHWGPAILENAYDIPQDHDFGNNGFQVWCPFGFSLLAS